MVAPLAECRSARVLVLGAYGAVGREVVGQLAATPLVVVAAGRKPTKLEAACAGLEGVQTRVVDAGDAQGVRAALSDCDVVINCVGPYLKFGFEIARAAVDAGVHYLDVASEQEHFRRVKTLHPKAEGAGVSVICGAGLYPGISGVLLRELVELERCHKEIELGLVMGSGDGGEDGLAQLESGVFELSFPLQEVQEGHLVRQLGGAPRGRVFPFPFGRRSLVPWPQLELLWVAEQFHPNSAWSGLWFEGQRPTPRLLLTLLSKLDPARRPRFRSALTRVLSRERRRSVRKDAGFGRHAAVRVQITGEAGSRVAMCGAQDGLVASAHLPAMLTRALLSDGVPPGVFAAAAVVSPREFWEVAALEGWQLERTDDVGEPAHG